MPIRVDHARKGENINEQPHRPILVASHPRSGTHLLIDLIRRHFQETRVWKRPCSSLDRTYINVERTTSDRRQFYPEDCAKIVRSSRCTIIKTHYLCDYSETWAEHETADLRPDICGLLEAAYPIYVYRNPISVMSSYREFLAASNTALSQVELSEFAEMAHWNQKDSNIQWWGRHVSGWLARPNILALKFEDILANPLNAIHKVAVHCGLEPEISDPLLPAQTKSIWKGRLDRLLPGHPKSTAINSKTKLSRPIAAERLAAVSAMPQQVRALCETLGYSFDKH